MSVKKPASLSGSIITAKGKAAPAPTLGSVEKTAPATPDKGLLVSITVRLSEENYRRLKIHGAMTRKSNQDIMLKALEKYFEKEDENGSN